MTDITVSLHNGTYVKLSCEANIAEEIKDFFSFRPANYRYDPRFKKGQWDGYIRCFSPWNKLLYVGLVADLEKFAKSRSYVIDFVNEFLTSSNNFSEHEANEFIHSLGIPAKYTPREHQVKAFVKAVRDRRKIILSPTSSGKSLIIYLLTMYYLAQGLKSLIIVPRIMLVNQLKADFVDYGFSLPEQIATIAEGSKKTNAFPITISTWQSIFRLPESWFQPFGFVIGDEVHEFDAKSAKTVVGNCTKAFHRVGLTGTVDNTKTHIMVLKGLFGEFERVANTKELMDKKIVADLKIKTILLRHDKLLTKGLKIKEYQQELEYLLTSKKRNNFIANLALSLKGNTLILYQRIEKQGNPLGELIRSKPSEKVLIEFRGDVSGEDRASFQKFMEENNNVIATATYGVLSTGVSIRNIHNLIFAHPLEGEIRLMQSIGRVLRLHESKETAVVYDIADRHSGYNKTFEHYGSRLNTYAKENFTYKQYIVELK